MSKVKSIQNPEEQAVKHWVKTSEDWLVGRKIVKCRYMSDEEMIGLYSHPKIKSLVSISHGEGWGLPLFEASYTGLPIVTTNWSGQCDFLNMPEKRRKKGSKKKTELK